MSNRNRKLNHHRSAHNGKHRVRKGDVFQPRPRSVYRRPCGCTNAQVPTKNELMIRIILRTRPTMVWGQTGWNLKVPDHLHVKFNRCFKHLSDLDIDSLKERGVVL
jgi:hypothetical protein